ncbi:MAG: hypothetical protein II214_01565 [Alistipes sp.]|nr:hypothetical protein [Alistipes sp.]
MKRLVYFIILTAGLLATSEAEARKQEQARKEVLSRSRGFYKEVLMDGGVALTSRYYLPATRFLGAKMDYFTSASNKNLTQQDTLIQKNIICGSKEDTNGWLLYPDGSPRFRMIYVNGGKANHHAISLGEEGRKAIQAFVAAGGSYLGTCAGAFIATRGSVRAGGGIAHADIYWGLWPGYAQRTRLFKNNTGMELPKKSPLLRYFDFGGDKTVARVRHNGGCSAYEGKESKLPKGTEVLARYIFDNTDKVQIDGKASVWAYKANEQSGRVILCGSHPESVTEGERLEFMSAMMLYAMDGNPAPKIKGLLNEGVVREMNKTTEDNEPDYTRIGDKQYHHFELNVPRKCKKAIVTLEGYEGVGRFDLTLCAKQGELAYHDNTTLKSVSRGVKKSLTIENPKSGKWFVSVFCENTVSAYLHKKYGTYYRGRVAVLNGVPYKISVKYE